MPLSTVILDPQMHDHASDARQAEWNANSNEFLASTQERFMTGVDALRIGVDEQRFWVGALDAQGASVAEFEIPHDILSEHIQEYVDIVREIDTSISAHRTEALDMAKKVTHDRAGRVLKRQLRDLNMNLQAARRLFTLLLSLKLDTTKLAGIYGHRRIR